mmetsp:Transcript_101759/g.294491  ORF Transcript_101759/g.294491 Transcript_101759/m.294491 type:complete len:235 (-) Transcript_101759:290-994(-)
MLCKCCRFWKVRLLRVRSKLFFDREVHVHTAGIVQHVPETAEEIATSVPDELITVSELHGHSEALLILPPFSFGLLNDVRLRLALYTFISFDCIRYRLVLLFSGRRLHLGSRDQLACTQVFPEKHRLVHERVRLDVLRRTGNYALGQSEDASTRDRQRGPIIPILEWADELVDNHLHDDLRNRRHKVRWSLGLLLQNLLGLRRRLSLGFCLGLGLRVSGLLFSLGPPLFVVTLG